MIFLEIPRYARRAIISFFIVLLCDCSNNNLSSNDAKASNRKRAQTEAPAPNGIISASPAIPIKRTTAELVKIGASEACATEDIKHLIISAIMPDRSYLKGEASTRFPRATFLFDSISYLESSPDTVACHASLRISLDGSAIRVTNRINVDYLVATDLLHPGKVSLRGNFSQAVSEAIMTLEAYGIFGSSSGVTNSGSNQSSNAQTPQNSTNIESEDAEWSLLNTNI